MTDAIRDPDSDRKQLLRFLKQVIGACAVALAFVTVTDAGVMSADITDVQYGAVPDDGKDDTAAIQKAIDGLDENGRLTIPPGTFTVNMGTGLRISKKYVHVIVSGTVEARTNGLESPDCRSLFYVTGEGCQFIGQGGILAGDGSTFHGPLDEDGLYPALIHFRNPAHEGSVTGLRLRDPPGAHVVFLATSDCSMTNCIVEGGTEIAHEGNRLTDGNPLGGAARYFAVYFIGVNDLLVQGNRFKPYEGRQPYQWLTSSSRRLNNSVSIIGNTFEGSWDHPIYCSGIFRSVVSNNITRNTAGTAIKLIGSNLVVVGNNIHNASRGGIECRIGSRCIVANNLVDQFGHVAIEITDYNNNRQSHTDNIVQGNTLIGHMDEGKPPVMAGIRIIAVGTVSRCKVEGNIIHNSGTGNAQLDAKLPASPAIRISGGEPSDALTIRGNTIHNARADGISLKNVRTSLIAHNIIHCAGKPIRDENGQDNVMDRNMTVDQPIRVAE